MDKKTREYFAKIRGTYCEKCKTNPWKTPHHIDRNPNNNNPKNILLVCSSCHIKAHIEIRKEAIAEGKLWELHHNPWK